MAIANVVPGICVELYKAYRAGDTGTSGKRQRTASHVNNVLVASHPQVAAIKFTLNKMGYGAGEPRRPLLPLGEAEGTAVEAALKGIRFY